MMLLPMIFKLAKECLEVKIEELELLRMEAEQFDSRKKKTHVDNKKANKESRPVSALLELPPRN